MLFFLFFFLLQGFPTELIKNDTQKMVSANLEHAGFNILFCLEKNLLECV